MSESRFFLHESGLTVTTDEEMCRRIIASLLFVQSYDGRIVEISYDQFIDIAEGRAAHDTVWKAKR